MSINKDSQKAPNLRFKGFTDDWEQRKLGDIADFSKGQGFSKKDLTKKGTPIILYGSLYTNFKTVIENINTFTSNGEGAVISEGGELIIPSSGESPSEIARATVVLMKGVILGGDLNILKFAHENNSIFIAFSLSSEKYKNKLAKFAQGKSIVHLYNSDIKDLGIYIASPEEQSEISKLLLLVENTITLHQRKLDQLNQLKEALLQQMFPGKGETVPNLRFAGFEGDWEQRRLGDFVIKAVDNRGKTPPTQEFGRYPLLEVASLGKASPDYTKVTKYVDEETYNGWFRAHIKKDDILFSTVGNTGLVTLMDDYAGATIAQNIVAFRAIEGNNPQFLVQMFQLPENLKRAKRIEMGAVQPSIKVSQLIHVSYLLPNSEQEQEKIGNFLNCIENTITLHQRKLEQLQNMKQVLLQNMFI
ncbi:restriction endonuclease subunit S [Carnobacterium sp. PL24RED07]|uniref:restriction endonuclease subunit S n=1 Tax=unclassified Carnobacterium TaxID=257487 RepID=UPI0013F78312|nr:MULTISPECIES: restriction endonuclease subunit S [unclassified Carnobacterium]KAF3302351.1 restriction endonuclease subunit S [Carnobacterium sp. PL26RED25]KAF3306053.1 restriction endonuclease subunit S [Carnobacterium sp. PL24RED07]